MGIGESNTQGRECTIFTVNVDDQVYRCPVSSEALYMLCRGQDTSLSQLDAYLLLKKKVSYTVERMVQEKAGEVPGLLEPGHFIASPDWDTDRDI